MWCDFDRVFHLDYNVYVCVWVCFFLYALVIITLYNFSCFISEQKIESNGCKRKNKRNLNTHILSVYV